ncbi:7927_t:CDS:2 [Entrophospora sp. SA101]|nr:7927_t:CDS:2 [Entrophospora sp. SA101]
MLDDEAITTGPHQRPQLKGCHNRINDSGLAQDEAGNHTINIFTTPKLKSRGIRDINARRSGTTILDDQRASVIVDEQGINRAGTNPNFYRYDPSRTIEFVAVLTDIIEFSPNTGEKRNVGLVKEERDVISDDNTLDNRPSIYQANQLIEQLRSIRNKAANNGGIAPTTPLALTNDIAKHVYQRYIRIYQDKFLAANSTIAGSDPGRIIKNITAPHLRRAKATKWLKEKSLESAIAKTIYDNGMVSANPNFDPQLILKDFYDNLAPIVNFNPALTASYQGKGLTGQQAAAAYGSQPSLPDPERIDADYINNAVDNNDLNERKTNITTAINQVRDRHAPMTPPRTPTSLHTEIEAAIQAVHERFQAANFSSSLLETEVLGQN